MIHGERRIMQKRNLAKWLRAKTKTPCRPNLDWTQLQPGRPLAQLRINSPYLSLIRRSVPARVQQCHNNATCSDPAFSTSKSCLPRNYWSAISNWSLECDWSVRMRFEENVCDSVQCHFLPWATQTNIPVAHLSQCLNHLMCLLGRPKAWPDQCHATRVHRGTCTAHPQTNTWSHWSLLHHEKTFERSRGVLNIQYFPPFGIKKLSSGFSHTYLLHITTNLEPLLCKNQRTAAK